MAGDTFNRGHGFGPTFDEASVLFAYQADTDGGRLVVRLFGIDTEGGAVRVAAEIYPVHAHESNDPQWRFYDFASRKSAQIFADETLIALEYLGCMISEPEPETGAADSDARANGASDRFAA